MKAVTLSETSRVPRYLWGILVHTLKRYADDGCQATAAALTYQTLFAVVPLLTVMYAVLNAVEAFKVLSAEVEGFLFKNVVPENVGHLQLYLHDFSIQAQSLSIPSLIFLAVTAFLMLFTIERTFNEIWRVREPRQGYQRFLMYWALLSLGPLLVGMGFVITTYLLALPLLSDVDQYAGFLRYVSVLLSAAMLTLVYVAVPNCTVSLKHALLGGLLVAIAFETAKYLFGFVMSRSSFEIIYGAFAAVPLFLLWIYVSWSIVLMGAELVKALGVYRLDGGEQQEAPLLQVMLILELFFRAHQAGLVLREDDLSSHGARIDLEHWSDYRQMLIALNLIRSVDKGGLVLSRDLREVSLWDLHQSSGWPMPTTIKGSSPWERALAENLQTINQHNKALLKGDLESLFRLEDKE